MLLNCEFGYFLNELYKWFEQMKINGHIASSWQVWLNTHINISASHARNLRQLASIVKTYPKLKAIDLPLNEVLKNQKLLKEMLAISEVAAFWKEDQYIPLQTQQSQEQPYQRRLQHNRGNQGLKTPEFSTRLSILTVAI